MAFLQKPVTPLNLAWKVREVLEGKAGEVAHGALCGEASSLQGGHDAR